MEKYSKILGKLSKSFGPVYNVGEQIYLAGTSLNCTKTELLEVTKCTRTKLHKAKFARSQICTRVNFAQVIFLHKSKKIRKNIKKQKKKLLTKG